MFTLYKVSRIVSSDILFSSYSTCKKATGKLSLDSIKIKKIEAQDAQTAAQLKAGMQTGHFIIADEDIKTGKYYFHTILTTSEKPVHIQIPDKQNPGKIETIEKKPELITKNEIANFPGQYHPKDQSATTLHRRVEVSAVEVKQSGEFKAKSKQTIYSNKYAKKIDSLVDGNDSKDSNTDIKL